MSSDNPYSSPSGGYAPQHDQGTGSVEVRSSVDYLECFGKVFENPNWFINAIVVGLVQYIPLVGGLIVIGYSIDSTHAKATGQTNSHVDFDLNRFGEYLIRGFWMFLSLLVAGLILIPVVFFLWLVTVAMIVSGSQILALVGFLFCFIAILTINLVSMFTQVPVMIRSGFTSSFSEAFDFAWIKDFIAKMWVEMVVGGIVFSLLASMVMMLGMLAFCVGVIPAFGVVVIAGSGFNAQLYQVYVGRGGQVVPFRDAGSL